MNLAPAPEHQSVDLSEFVAPRETLLLYRRVDGGWTVTKSKSMLTRRRDAYSATGATLEECLAKIQAEIDRQKEALPTRENPR